MRSVEFQEAVVSVFDFERIIRPLVEVCGYTHVALPDAPRAQFNGWQLPAGCTRIEQCMLVPRDAHAGRGAMRLVRFHGVAQHVMRSSQRSWDTGGIFDVDMFTADVDHVYRGLQRFGWTALGDPVDYSEAHFSVRQVVAVGPDGLMLAIIQRYSPLVPELDPAGTLSPIFNSTQMVADYAAAAAFYRDTLGWGEGLEFTIEGQIEPGAEVLGLPLPYAEHAKRQLGIFNPPGLSAGGVELIRNHHMRGRRFDAECVAPNVGILCLRFQVDDAVAYADEIRARTELHVAPMRMTISPYGEVIVFAVRSPEGAILEFFSVAGG